MASVAATTSPGTSETISVSLFALYARLASCSQSLACFVLLWPVLTQASSDPPGPLNKSEQVPSYLPLMRKQYVLASAQTDALPASENQESSVALTTPLLASLRRAGSRPGLRRQGSSARRTGPITPPLHQLLLANGALSTISILSSSAVASNGTSPRSSASLDSLVDDGSVTLSADEQIKPKELVTMLAEENEELYLDNLEFNELLDARQQALVRAHADLKESKASVAVLEKKLQRRQEKYQVSFPGFYSA